MLHSDIWYEITLRLCNATGGTPADRYTSRCQSIFNLMFVCKDSLKGVRHLLSFVKNGKLPNGLKHGKIVSMCETSNYFCGSLHGLYEKYLSFSEKVEYIRGFYKLGEKEGAHYTFNGFLPANKWNIIVEYHFRATHKYNENYVDIYKYNLTPVSKDDYSYSSNRIYNKGHHTLPPKNFLMDGNFVAPTQFYEFLIKDSFDSDNKEAHFESYEADDYETHNHKAVSYFSRDREW